jgi:radical SAM superfamily enzyme YgiQ (UPF0313 family)
MVRAESLKRDSYFKDKIQRKSLAPPFGLYRVAHFLSEDFHSDVEAGRLTIDVIDPALAMASGGLDQLFANVRQQAYDIVGFSPVRLLLGEDLFFMNEIYKCLCATGKRPLFLAGGNEASNNSEVLLSAMPWLDFCIWGLGEPFLRYLLKRMLASRTGVLHQQDLYDLPGRIRRTGAGVSGNTYRMPHEELYRYLNYAGTNIPYEEYWDYANRISGVGRFAPLARLYTTSYCPHHCTFCSDHPLGRSICGDSPVALIPEHVARCMEIICRKKQAKAIYFNDNDAFLSTERARQLLAEIIRQKRSGFLPADLQLLAQTRVDNVDPQILALARDAGFVWLSFGVEAFADESLAARDLNKGYDSGLAWRTVNASLRYLPVTNINLILFHPTTTRRAFLTTVGKTVELIENSLSRHGRLSVNTFLLIEAYPGAPLNRLADIEGWLRERERVSYEGQSWEYTASYLPLDPEMRECVAGGRLLAAYDALMEEITADKRWPDKPVPRTIGVNSLAMFLAAYQLLRVSPGESTVSASRMRDLIFKLVSKFYTAGEPASTPDNRPRAAR